MSLDNDTRGWVMASVSGVACILGASVICADLIVRLVPRWRNFRIQDSNRFLAGSLSLSAGVMIYSALYSMLPSSKSSLIKSGWQPSPAAFLMIACFLGGVVGIQVLSKLMHQFIPSHIVDCDHTHKDEENGGEQPYEDEGLDDHEDRPLLSRDLSEDEHLVRPQARKAHTDSLVRPGLHIAQNGEKPSTIQKLAQRMTSFVQDSNQACVEGGPCLGFSNPCGNECYKVISPNPSKTLFTPTSNTYGTLSIPRRQSTKITDTPETTSKRTIVENGHHTNRPSAASSDTSSTRLEHSHHSAGHDPGSSHHHHVASNAFLSIGLQTSIAIALHKLPEGFITYATNHANPKLGVSIFMALFIHNITEGFALALPLYLALNNRLKAMIWASILGGASQPLGAGIAALWFKVAQSRDMTPSEGVYGVMFAITAGIMTNVALQLFSESLSLTHHKGLCISMAFVGMGILGFSNALTAS